jgi:hypothetical protein
MKFLLGDKVRLANPLNARYMCEREIGEISMIAAGGRYFVEWGADHIESTRTYMAKDLVIAK